MFGGMYVAAQSYFIAVGTIVIKLLLEMSQHCRRFVI